MKQKELIDPIDLTKYALTLTTKDVYKIKKETFLNFKSSNYGNLP